MEIENRAESWKNHYLRMRGKNIMQEMSSRNIVQRLLTKLRAKKNLKRFMKIHEEEDGN